MEIFLNRSFANKSLRGVELTKELHTSLITKPADELASINVSRN